LIQKVAVQIQATGGVLVTQTFEQVVDDSDEAKEFGELSAQLALAFVAGFAEGSDEPI
jgi:hypothetical protein